MDPTEQAAQAQPNFINPAYATPQQLAQLRAYANQLTGTGQTNAQLPGINKWQGLSNIANMLVGKYQNAQANDMQRQLLQQGQQAMQGAGAQNPYANLLLGGGVPQQPQQQIPQQQIPQVQGQQAPTGVPGQSAQQSQSGLPQAIGQVESNGNYNALGPVTKTGDRAYGKYQVMGANVGPWTKEVVGQSLTPQQFMQNPKVQDAVAQTKLAQYAQAYGPEGASRAWFAGPGNMNNPNAQDQLGTSVSGYQARVGQQMQPMPQQQMAQNQPQMGQQSNAAMAHMYMDPNVPAEFKTGVMAGQVPQIIEDVSGKKYLYKPGMAQPVPMGLQGPGAPIKVGPGTFEGGVGTIGALNGGQGNQPNQQGLNNLNPTMNWAATNAANVKGAEAEASKTGEKLAEYKGLGVDANQLAGNLDTLKQLGQKVGYGLGPQVQNWMAQRGIYTPGVSEIQAYQNFIPYVGVLLRPEGSGRLMTQELQQFNSALGGLMMTPQGRETAIDSLSRIAHYKGEIANIANDTGMGANERMSKINSLPVPQIDWKAINAAGGSYPQGQQIDPAAIAEAKRRGLM